MAASRSDQGIDLLKSDLKKRVERISNVLGLTFKIGVSGATSFSGGSVVGAML